MKNTTRTILTIATAVAWGSLSPETKAIDLASLARASLVAPETLLTHRETLGLSAEQEEKIKKIRGEAVEKSQPMEATIKERQKNLEDVMKAEGTTFEAAEASLKSLIEAEAALKSHQLRSLLALRDTLTAEQRTRAMALTRQDAAAGLPVEGGVKEKAGRLKAAFDAIGIEPTESLKAKGKAVEEIIAGGDYEAASKALDDLIAETGLNEPAGETPADFSGFDAGATDLDSLKQRIADVESKARGLTKLPKLRQLLGAKDDLEAAKAAEDAVLVGRILTWAEGVLK